MDRLDVYIESLIFASDKPISATEIGQALFNGLGKRFTMDDIENSLSNLIRKYDSDDFAFGVRGINQAFQFYTKSEYHHIIESHIKDQNRKRLSKAALETLSIIAYQQPVSRIDIEQIRGVNCEYTLQKLLEKELIEISGRMDAPGRPLIYRTSGKFMQHFGLNALDELPKLSELENEERNTIGPEENIELK